MLCRIVEYYDGVLPENVTVVFCNTGREHPQTYEFVARVGEHLGVDIAWLEYRYDESRRGGISDPIHRHEEVTYETASRDGKPFDDLIRSKKRLPNLHRRFCTQELKVMTIYRYMRRQLGVREWHSVLGIRADEPRRAFRMLAQPCSARPEKLPSLLPLFDNDITQAAVYDFWGGMPFQLELPKALGNCDLCFLKGKNTKAEALRLDPSIAEWWLAHELENGKRHSHIRDRQRTQFDEHVAVTELVELSKTPGLFDEETSDDIPCHCTD